MNEQTQQAQNHVFQPKPAEHRYDFVLFFEVREGNPNGDPDAGNLPRTDPLTQEGLVTDVSIKRKWRDYVFQVKEEKREAGYDIFVRHRGILANQQRQAIADSQKATFEQAKPIQKKDKQRDSKIDAATAAACRRYVDVRTFGAVMTTGKVEGATGDGAAEWNCGQVKGPVQLTFARSVHKISPVQWSIARVAQTNPGENQTADAEGESEHGTFGQKPTIGYALYRTHGFVSASLAEKTLFGPEDLELLFEGLANMYDRHHSASAGMQSTVGLYVFEHEDRYGNCHASRLFDTIKTTRVKAGEDGEALWVDDFPTSRASISISHDLGTLKNKTLPKGVTLWTWDFDERKLVEVAKGPGDGASNG